jgi:hypothetical protein
MVNLRFIGDSVQMKLDLAIHDERRGDSHKTITMWRKHFPGGHRSLYRVDTPEEENEIALLVSEDMVQDGVWMYFPSTLAVTRVMSRGFTALATDFSCEDLLQEVPLGDYRFRLHGKQNLDGVQTVQIEKIPIREELSSELGYAKAIHWIREDIRMVVRSDFYDEQGKLSRVYRAGNIRHIHGIVTALDQSMEDLRTNHTTRVRIARVDYEAHLAAENFEKDRMGASRNFSYLSPRGRGRSGFLPGRPSRNSPGFIAI